MATLDLTRRPPLAEVVSGRVAAVAAVAGLVGLSLLLRATQLHAGFWIDEGISVGVAHHHWTSIPHLLRQDGSPPAYYMLLGLWIRVFGDGEAATHSLSLVFSLASIPVAYAAGRSIYDRRTGFVCALLVAVTPYLTYYAQETRMYAFESFLSLVAVLAYVNGVLRGGRAWAVLLVPTLALMVYGHNWALFFCVALALATVLYARSRLRTFGLVAAGVAVLYLPWVPTLLRRRSTPVRLGRPGRVSTSCSPPQVRCSAATRRSSRSWWPAAAGLVYARGRIERVLAVLVGATILLAWLSSQISPAWTTRYFSVVLGPVVLLAAAIVTRGGRVGMVALVAVLFLWWGFSVKNEKENAKQIAAQLAPFVQPGELVVSTHPEQVPVLRYYLGGGLRWATTLGPVADSQVFDWRDAVSRLRAAQPRATLDPLLASVPRGNGVRGRRARSSATTGPGRPSGRVSSGNGPSSGRRCSSATRACGSSTTS